MKKVKNYVMIVLVAMLMLFTSNVQAASSSLTGTTSAKPGDTVTVNVNINAAAAWDLKISYDTSKLQLLSGSLSKADAPTGKNWSGVTQTLTFKAVAEGTAWVKLSGDLSDENHNMSAATGTLNVAIKTPVAPPIDNGSSGGSSGNQGGSTTTTKSKNNYLKTLQLDVEGMTPRFVKTKYDYTLAVNQNVNNIEVTAVPEDSKAKVSISGNTNLKDGDNHIYVKVTAEAGNYRTYEIVVTRSADPEKANAYLSNLVIEDISLDPAFASEILEYQCGTVKNDVEKLNILAFAQNERAKIEIYNNELRVGENKVIIKVIAEDGVNYKEYILNVVKEEDSSQTNAMVNIYDDQEKETTDQQDNKIAGFFKNLWKAIKDNSLLVLMYLFIIVEFVQIVYLYKKLNGKEKNIIDKKEMPLGRDLVKNEIKENKIEEGASAEQILNNMEPRKRSAAGANIKDLTEEKKAIEEKEVEETVTKIENEEAIENPSVGKQEEIVEEKPEEPKE